MSRDVRSAFQVIVKSFGLGQTDKEAEDYLASLDDQKLYMTDVWG
jgi:sulfite reductase alpha subunit-like flavoprotein